MPARSTVSPNAAPIWSSLQILAPPTMSQRASVINGTPTARSVMAGFGERVQRDQQRAAADRKPQLWHDDADEDAPRRQSQRGRGILERGSSRLSAAAIGR